MRLTTNQVVKKIRNDETLIDWEKAEMVYPKNKFEYRGYYKKRYFFLFRQGKIITTYFFNVEYGSSHELFDYKRMSMKKMQKWFDDFLIEHSRK